MTLSSGGSFPAEYEAEFIDLPGSGEADFTFTDGRGPDRVRAIAVVPTGATPWTGTFAATDPPTRLAVSGIFATPNPTVLSAVVRGTPFLVNARRPANYELVRSGGPVVAVQQAIDDMLLLLVTPWAVAAVGSAGVAWTTRRIAIEGIRLDEIEAGWLRGVADPDDAEPREFAIALATGDVIGGAAIS